MSHAYEHDPGPELAVQPVMDTDPFVSVVGLHVDTAVHAEHTRFVVAVHAVDSYVLPVHAGVHDPQDVAPVPSENVPSVQEVHCVAVVPDFPAVAEDVPTGQGIHTLISPDMGVIVSPPDVDVGVSPPDVDVSPVASGVV